MIILGRVGSEEGRGVKESCDLAGEGVEDFEGDGEGAVGGRGGSVPIWPPGACWFSGQSLTQMFAQCPGQALASSQTFK